MKRAGANEDTSKLTKRVKLESSSTLSNTKLSKTIDIFNTLDLELVDHEVHDKNGNKVLYSNITKNSKIDKQINKALTFLNSNNEKSEVEKELLLIGKGEGIQKMITIIEILKQKLNQLKKPSGDQVVTNDMIAKTENRDEVIIRGVKSDSKIESNYSQLNYLDYIETTRESKTKSTEIEGVYDKKVLDDILKVDKTVKVPVLYIYMHFAGTKNKSNRSTNKINNLVSNGWSIQLC